MRRLKISEEKPKTITMKYTSLNGSGSGAIKVIGNKRPIDRKKVSNVKPNMIKHIRRSKLTFTMYRKLVIKINIVGVKNIPTIERKMLSNIIYIIGDKTNNIYEIVLLFVMLSILTK